MHSISRDLLQGPILSRARGRRLLKIVEVSFANYEDDVCFPAQPMRMAKSQPSPSFLVTDDAADDEFFLLPENLQFSRRIRWMFIVSFFAFQFSFVYGG